MTTVRFLAALALVAAAAWSPPPARAAETFPPEQVKLGEKTYNTHCIRCHGIRMVNPVGFTYDLRKFPREQKDRFFTSVSKGKGDMPPWGDLLKAEQIEGLWAYVQTEGKK